MLRSVIEYFVPPAVGDRAAFARFLSGEASYLAQRCTYEFARNTLGYFGQHHFGDDRFNDAFRISRWESFAAILAGMVLLAEARLRPHAGDAPDRLIDPLTQLYREMLAEYPLPAHRAQGWEADVSALRDRLVHAQAAPPQSPAVVSQP